jgi:6,7-dimethyl-8-ribityllumazine synthase
MREREGRLRGDGRRFAIAVSRTNDLVTRPLLAGALDSLRRHGVSEADLDVVWVPGSWELPDVVARLAETRRYASVIALGAIVRGETPHFDYLCRQVLAGLADAAARSGVYVALGVLTTDSFDQAIERAGGKAGNYGSQAALAAVEMADLLSQLDEESD